MGNTRLITVYVVQGLLFVVLLFIAYKILKRDKKRLNQIFSGFYISLVIGLLFNFIYLPFEDDPMVLYMNYLTNLFVYSGVVFLVVFCLILLKSEKAVDTKLQLLVILGIYLVFGIGMMTLNLFPETRVEFTGKDFAPVWPFPFFIFMLLAFTLANFIPLCYLLYKIFNQFSDAELKKKWLFFSVGVIFILSYGYLVFLNNFSNNDSFRTITSYLGFILVLSGSILMYFGVGRQLSK
ncbi:MAG: hypothetical protein JW891_09915 [Candidatus Lokiarchaeota archaeon]|nr:hypothetical protein [Candidatus Lokiarchaeota archaeon]